MVKFDPKTDIPDLSGKVILVTGGTGGLGQQAVLLFAAHSPSHLIITGRSESRAQTFISDLHTKFPLVKVSFVPLDLNSLKNVQIAAQKVLSLTDRLDLLINNAGVMSLPPLLSADGYEIQFANNHLNPALLTNLLLPLLLKTAKLPDTDVRVVTLSSQGAYGHPVGGINFSTLRTTQSSILPTGTIFRYCQSKLANVLYSMSLQTHYPLKDSGILFLSIHPGVWNTPLLQGSNRINRWMTNISEGRAARDPSKDGEGGWNTVWAATSKEPRGEGRSGFGFYLPVGEVAERKRCVGDEKLAEKLWEWTEKELEGWKA